MSKNSHFKGPFNKQHGKRAQTLLNSVSQQPYDIHCSLARRLFSKKSLLLTCQILRLLPNTLGADEKYPVLNRDNLTITIQMILSEKKNFFSQFFAAFSKSKLKFEHFDRKYNPHSFLFSKLRTLKAWLDKCLKSPTSEDYSTTNMVNVPKHCCSLHHNTFIIFINHCQGN